MQSIRKRYVRILLQVALDYLACGLDPEKGNDFYSVYGSGADRAYLLLYESGNGIQTTEESYRKSGDQDA